MGSTRFLDSTAFIMPQLTNPNLMIILYNSILPLKKSWSTNSRPHVLWKPDGPGSEYLTSSSFCISCWDNLWQAPITHVENAETEFRFGNSLFLHLKARISSWPCPKTVLNVSQLLKSMEIQDPWHFSTSAAESEANLANPKSGFVQNCSVLAGHQTKTSAKVWNLISLAQALKMLGLHKRVTKIYSKI